ncbi:MAG: alpha/beta fold hydrolase [Pseudomonadota bacterium]
MRLRKKSSAMGALGQLMALMGLLFTSSAGHAQKDVDDRIESALTQDPIISEEHPATVVELQIPSSGTLMPAHIYLAEGPGPHPTVVFLHGIPGNERNLDIAQNLRRFGFNTLFFHYRGAWGAGGSYRITQLPDDALAVLDFLRGEEKQQELRVDTDALSLLGHSLGGYTALAAGSRDLHTSCVVALAPANVALWKDQVSAGGPQIDRLSAYADSLFMLHGLSGERLKEELAFADREQLDTTAFGVGLSGKSVLLMVGEDDQATPPESMFDPVVAAYSKAEGIDLMSIKVPGDHSFSRGRVGLSRAVMRWMDSRCR